MRRLLTVAALLFFLLVAATVPAQAQGTPIHVLDETASYVFAKRLEFEITTDVDLYTARIYYRIEGDKRYVQLADVVGRTAKKVITVSQGEIPPAAEITYFWRLEATNGQLLRTEEKSFLYLDQQFSWRNKTEGDITVFWYGPDAHGETVLGQLDDSFAQVEERVGLTQKGPIKVVVYYRPSQMRLAIGSHPDGVVVLGTAFGGQHLVTSLAWGWKATLTHELTHVLHYQHMEGPYDHLPFWLCEGLATYAEGTNRGSITKPMRLYKLNRTPDDANDAVQAYAQAQSMMRFLIEEHGGKEKIVELLTVLAEGNTVDDGLLSVYGFDRNGLEREWRDWIGKPLPTPTPTPVPAPTPEPTKPEKPAEKSPLDVIFEFFVGILRWLVLPKAEDKVPAPRYI